MATTAATVTVHVNVELNGEPVILTAPAHMEEIEGNQGLHIYVDLDTQALAKALLPDLLRLLPAAVRNATGIRNY